VYVRRLKGGIGRNIEFEVNLKLEVTFPEEQLLCLSEEKELNKLNR
jgi:hypothetical protein